MSLSFRSVTSPYFILPILFVLPTNQILVLLFLPVSLFIYCPLSLCYFISIESMVNTYEELFYIVLPLGVRVVKWLLISESPCN